MARITVKQFVGQTTPVDWAEYVIGAFDPKFRDTATTLRFFSGWCDATPGKVVAKFEPYASFDQATRFSKDDAEYEMLMLQGCVGNDVFLYLLPYVAADERTL